MNNDQNIDFCTLRKFIARAFNLAEIRELCFDLKIDFEDLGGNEKRQKVIELIDYYNRRNMLPDLIETCARRRPSIKWDECYKFHKAAYRNSDQMSNVHNSKQFFSASSNFSIDLRYLILFLAIISFIFRRNSQR